MASLSSPSPSVRRPELPVTLRPGMRVFSVAETPTAVIVGVTEQQCLYRHAGGGLGVARWSEIALGDICPAAPLLPVDVPERDCQNAQANVLRELLLLQPWGLSATQQAALDELATQLGQWTG